MFKQYFALVVITSSVFTPLYLDKTSPAHWHSYLLIFHLVCISLIWTICITGKNNCFTGPFFLKKAGPSGRFESSAKDLSQQTSFLQEAGSSVWHMYDICMTYVWHMYDLGMTYVWLRYDLCMTYIWHMYDIWPNQELEEMIWIN